MSVEGTGVVAPQARAVRSVTFETSPLHCGLNMRRVKAPSGARDILYGETPYGWRLSADRSKLILDSDEQRLLAVVRHMYFIERVPMRQIVGREPPRDGRHQPPWSPLHPVGGVVDHPPAQRQASGGHQAAPPALTRRSPTFAPQLTCGVTLSRPCRPLARRSKTWCSYAPHLRPRRPPAQDALARLREGNQRFVRGEGNAIRRWHPGLADGQAPFATVLGCADSRAPAEYVFDQGLGDLFVIRVAGNIVAPSLVGSVEFAASQFGTRLVVVMGHTQCGAIGATVSALENEGAPESRNQQSIVDRIKPHIAHLFSGLSGLQELRGLATTRPASRPPSTPTRSPRRASFASRARFCRTWSTAATSPSSPPCTTWPRASSRSSTSDGWPLRLEVFQMPPAAVLTER